MKVNEHRLYDDHGSHVAFRESPNHGGALDPRYLVIHYTAGRSADGAASWLCNPKAKASAHLVIGRDGSIVQLVPFNVVAWHAGASAWQDGRKRLVGLNRHSIGIELDNPGRLMRRGDRWRSLALGTEYPDSDVIEAAHKNETRASGWHVYPTEQLDVLFEVCAALVIGQVRRVRFEAGGFERFAKAVERPAAAERAVHEHDGRDNGCALHAWDDASAPAGLTIISAPPRCIS